MKATQIFLIIALTMGLASGWTGGLGAPSAFGKEFETIESDQSPVFLNRVLDGLESRYLATGFSAKFVQISSIKAMDISDTAHGAMWVKPPGQMRWEYDSPDRQVIVSNGKNMWIYRPQDNQVMIGKSPTFFGDGKGAGFLSDIRQIREKFEISLEKPENPDVYLLKLVPQQNMLDLAVIYLSINRTDFHVTRIITRNVYEDETILNLSDIRFDSQLSNDLFTFVTPKNADIFRIDE